MEVVEEFLRLRREGKGEEAYAMLAPGASMGCPWGGMHHGNRVQDLLRDEARFFKKGYLDPVTIEKIDEGTYQRKFKWDRGMAEYGNSGFRYFGVLPMWRELYFVRDGKIELVTSDKLLKHRSLLHAFFGTKSAMKRNRHMSEHEDVVRALKAGVQALSVSSTISTKDLVCRGDHARAIQEFLADPQHHTMQIFGMPGTGKTATVNYALAQLASRQGAMPTAVFLNGFVVQKSADMYYTLHNHLMRARLGKVEQCPVAQCAARIEKHFRHGWAGRQPGLCVIVVDEVDKILEKHAKGLFKVVDWLTLPYANCKLITISNSMDLRLDAKTKSRLGVINQLVFSSYGTQELREILLHRVGAIKPKLFADQAVNQLCTQTASHYGDVRRLLQSASAAICSVLMRMQDDSVDTSKQDGIITLREIHTVVRQIFHDRFVEFITTMRAPVLFITVAVLGKETEELVKRREVDYRLPLERVLAITQQAQRTCMGTPRCISRVAFLEEIELLRQVSLVEVSVGDDRIPVHSAEELLESTEDVHVSLLQPYQTVVDSCRLHDAFGATYGAALYL